MTLSTRWLQTALVNNIAEELTDLVAGRQGEEPPQSSELYTELVRLSPLVLHQTPHSLVLSSVAPGSTDRA